MQIFLDNNSITAKAFQIILFRFTQNKTCLEILDENDMLQEIESILSSLFSERKDFSHLNYNIQAHKMEKLQKKLFLELNQKTNFSSFAFKKVNEILDKQILLSENSYQPLTISNNIRSFQYIILQSIFNKQSNLNDENCLTL